MRPRTIALGSVLVALGTLLPLLQVVADIHADWVRLKVRVERLERRAERFHGKPTPWEIRDEAAASSWGER